MRRFWILTGGVLLLWALASVQTEAQERLKISYSSVDAPNANWYIAEDKKLYQKYGLEADLVFIPTSTTNVALSWRGQLRSAISPAAPSPTRLSAEPVSLSVVSSTLFPMS
jgi:ABC-type nitrate/sulfonate/bicarbonate transport system substrate-binding protein